MPQMNGPITFATRVLKVQVKEKKVNVIDPETDTKHEDKIRLGQVTLEFDADGVDVNRIAGLIGNMPVVLGLANTQMALDDAMRKLNDGELSG